MSEVKRIFNDRYNECNVQLLSEYDRLRYKLGNIDSPVVYSVLPRTRDSSFPRRRESSQTLVAPVSTEVGSRRHSINNGCPDLIPP